jgi:hypothetical protein
MKQIREAKQPWNPKTTERLFPNNESGQDSPWLGARKMEILGAIKHGKCRDVKAIVGLMNEWAKNLVTEQKASEAIGLMIRVGLIRKDDEGLSITELGEEHCPPMRNFGDLMYSERLLTHGSPPWSVKQILGRE